MPYSTRIETISTSKEAELNIQLSVDTPDFLSSIWSFEIFPKDMDGETDSRAALIGSGPYRLLDREGESRIILEANKSYYGGKPAIERIEFIYEPSKDGTWARLLRGETDIGQDVAPRQYEMMREYHDRFYFEEYLSFHYDILLFNPNDPLFSDFRVRKAMAHAIDSNEIIHEVLRGFGNLVAGPMGAGSSLASPNIRPVSFDPKVATSLLLEAGWRWDDKKRFLVRDGCPFEFTLLLPEGDLLYEKIGRYVLIYLNDVGVRVRLSTVPPDEYHERYVLNMPYQAIFAKLPGMTHYVDKLVLGWKGDGPSGSYFGGWNFPGINPLVDRIIRENDPKLKEALCHQFDEKVAALQPGVFLFQQKGVDVMSKRIEYPPPFILSNEGIARLWQAKIKKGS